MSAVRKITLARPRQTLLLWFACVGILSLLGLGVLTRLHAPDPHISDTPAAEAQQLTNERFGAGSPLLVLLQGPGDELRRQGPEIVARLAQVPGITVLDPWAEGLKTSALLPSSTKALVFVQAHGSFEHISTKTVNAVRSRLDRIVSRPVTAHMTGFADISNGITQAVISGIEKGALIATPLLLIILLLVFRSPVAAVLPLVIGGCTVGASTGVIDLVNDVVPLDVICLNLASMMGLALGIDYSLLVVSRFREELRAGAEVADAARTAVDTAGRTVRFAGFVLVVAMTVSVALAPGNVLVSLVVGALIATLISVLSSVVALPPLLLLVGDRVNRYSLPLGTSSQHRWASLAIRTISRPVVAALSVLGLLAVLATPALAFAIGAPDPRELPTSSRQFRDFAAIARALNGGWAAPYVITIVSHNGSITNRRTLAAISQWQSRLGKRDDVLAVMGPAAIAQRTRQLQTAPALLAQAARTADSGTHQLGELNNGLAAVGDGVNQLTGGLSTASSAASQLARGDRAAVGGGEQLQAGLRAAKQGAVGLHLGLGLTSSGAGELASALGRARIGGEQIRTAISTLQQRTGSGLPALKRLHRGLETGRSQLDQLRQPAQIAQANLQTALNELNNMLLTSKLDPAYRRLYTAVATAEGAITGLNPQTGQPIRPDYAGLDSSLATASTQIGQAASGVGALIGNVDELRASLGKLDGGASQLDRGLARLLDGAKQLHGGLSRLLVGSVALRSGTDALSSGAGELLAGLQQLNGGDALLSSKLASGAQGARPLGTGIGRMRSGVAGALANTSKLTGGLGDINTLSQIIASGYTTLAAIQTAGPQLRSDAAFVVNLNNGGTAAQLVVVGYNSPIGAAGTRLRNALASQAASFAAATNTTAAIGGPAAELQDFNSALASHLWPLILGVAGVTYLILIPILRSLLLPALTVILNLCTVAAAFGVLTFFFSGTSPRLGGPGWIDGISAIGIFAVAFALSIDYSVFLLNRMREGYELTGDPNQAVAYGLERTSGIITGAAMIMTGVFLAFALSSVVTMKQNGIGLTTAVLIDATLVRLVLLPACLRVLGHRAWRIREPHEPVTDAVAYSKG